jgi:hypothetical protein
MSSGSFNGVDLSVPINRVSVASVSNNLASFRPFNALSSIGLNDFRGTSDYNSMQATLSRQTGRRIQYFVAYTLAKSKGTLGNDFSNMDPYDPSRTYGVLRTDRTHILNLSWNAFLPDGARGSLDNVVLRGALNGWQLSGISTLASGIPVMRPPPRSLPPTSARPTSSVRGIRRVVQVLQATHYRRCTRAIHGSTAKMWVRGSSISTASACPRSARRAIWSRRTTSARPPA